MITTTDFLMDLLDMNAADAACVGRHLAADASAPAAAVKAPAAPLRDEYDTWPEEAAPTAPMNAADAASAVRHLLADVSMPPADAVTPTDSLLGLL